MELGTLREISILRILRADNGHPNVVSVNSNVYLTQVTMFSIIII